MSRQAWNNTSSVNSKSKLQPSAYTPLPLLSTAFVSPCLTIDDVDEGRLAVKLGIRTNIIRSVISPQTAVAVGDQKIASPRFGVRVSTKDPPYTVGSLNNALPPLTLPDASKLTTSL